VLINWVNGLISAANNQQPEKKTAKKAKKGEAPTGKIARVRSLEFVMADGDTIFHPALCYPFIEIVFAPDA
jgi:hypothetical protein